MPDTPVPDDNEPQVPQSPLPSLLVLLAICALAASFFFSDSVSRATDGQVMSFRDDGAICGGGAALLMCLLSLIPAFNVLGATKKTVNTWPVPVVTWSLPVSLGMLALFRMLYGFGLFH